MRNSKKAFLIIIVVLFLLFTQVSFAQTDNNLTLDDNSQDVSSVDDSDVLTDNVKNKTILIISDSPGTNVLDAAADELYNHDGLSGFNIVLRSGDQVKDMDENELHTLFDQSDAFIGEWISSDVDAVLTNLLGKYAAIVAFQGNNYYNKVAKKVLITVV